MRFLAALASALVLAAAQPAAAAITAAPASLVVGLWSTTMYSGPGTAYASFLYQFSPNGRFDEQMVVTPGGVANYTGTWNFDPQQMTLTYTIYDFSPPTIPPISGVGTPVTNRVEFGNGGYTMLVDQPGTVPLNLTRQR